MIFDCDELLLDTETVWTRAETACTAWRSVAENAVHALNKEVRPQLRTNPLPVAELDPSSKLDLDGRVPQRSGSTL